MPRPYLGSGHANLTSVRDCRLARPFAGEPRQVRLVTDTCLVLAGEQRIGLVQDEGVGAALPPGQVGDGQFGAVYPGVDMLPAVFGEGPLEGAPDLVVQERRERAAQLTCAAAGRQLNRPVADLALRLGPRAAMRVGTACCRRPGPSPSPDSARTD
jgi:hypothetical protein